MLSRTVRYAFRTCDLHKFIFPYCILANTHGWVYFHVSRTHTKAYDFDLQPIDNCQRALCWVWLFGGR